MNQILFKNYLIIEIYYLIILYQLLIVYALISFKYFKIILPLLFMDILYNKDN
jgi:hypothetical protein